jgi:hypothetical protein
MSDGAVMRVQYVNVATGTVRGGPTGRGESLTDFDAYLLPMERARGRSLHTWGVTRGLTVTSRVGQPGLAVSPGDALDSAGRMLLIRPGGTVILDPDVEPDGLVNIPTVAVDDAGVVLPTTGAATDALLTVTWREALGTGVIANGPVLLHAPWLRLVPRAGFAADGAQVVLARVALDADGGVLSVTADGRRLAGVSAQRLELRVARVESGVVDQRPGAELLARPDGGVELNLLGGPAARPVLSVDPRGGEVSLGAALRCPSVGIGTGSATPRRALQVEGTEVHSGGLLAGYSFASRGVPDLVESPAAGERWVWFADQGTARLWSGGDKLAVTPTGRLGIGMTDPGFRLDVNGRIRLRQNGESSAGLWLFQDSSQSDQAFVGMAGDGEVGFWGNTGAQWGLTVNTTSGLVNVKGGLRVPKTGDGPATLSARTFSNEAELSPNNLKLVMSERTAIVLQRQRFEFMVGYSSFFASPLLGVRTNFVRLFGVDQDGHAFFAGGKGGYVVDYFVNAAGDMVEQGDVVVLGSRGSSVAYGSNDAIPIPEVDLSDRPYDHRVCGIVADLVVEGSLPGVDPRSHAPADDADRHPLAEFAGTDEDERTHVRNRQMGRMVTLGSWAHCKVDADVAAIEVGDLLTTSGTRGHAQKVVDQDRAAGTVIGKAMAPLASGRGVIPVLVTIQ